MKRISIVCVCIAVLGLACAPRDTYWDYGEIVLEARGDDSFEGLRFEREQSTSEWYISYDAVGAFSVDEVSVDDLRQLPFALISRDEGGDERCTIGYDRFVFKDGKLDRAFLRLESEQSQLGIARSKEGPCIRLPAKPDVIRKVLGKPDHIRTAPTSLR